MEIKITKEHNGHMYAQEGVAVLFEFEFREESGAWLFWMPGRPYDPCKIPGKKFPMGYFLDACQACHFLRNDGGLNESVTVTGITHTIVK